MSRSLDGSRYLPFGAFAQIADALLEWHAAYRLDWISLSNDANIYPRPPTRCRSAGMCCHYCSTGLR